MNKLNKKKGINPLYKKNLIFQAVNKNTIKRNHKAKCPTTIISLA